MSKNIEGKVVVIAGTSIVLGTQRGKALPHGETRLEEEKNMRATVYHGAREMRIDHVPDPIIEAPKM